MRKEATFMMHAGAEEVTREMVDMVATPARTDTWTPIPHSDLIDMVIGNITNYGMQVTEEQHGLYKDGDRYFGVFKLAQAEPDFEKPVVTDVEIVPPDWSMCLGLRNSHDKSFPANLLGGSWVFVCDNLSFSGEIKITRRHTRYIMRDIPNLVSRAVATLVNKRGAIEQRIEAYKETPLVDAEAHDLLVRALDARAITTTQLPKVLHEWRNPRHPEFEPRSVWSLSNGVTEVLKAAPTQLPARTMALNGVLDGFAGVLEGLGV